MYLSKQQRYEEVKKVLDENIDLFPEVLNHISTNMNQYQSFCKKQNDSALREVAGDLMTIMSQKKLPPKDVITRLCIRVKRYIFPNGITKEGYFHTGEKNFYEKYLKTYDEEKKAEYDDYIKTVGEL